MIDAHLVGSVPLADAEAVFRSVAAALGDRMVRIPDGETGARKDWIAWQYAVLVATPGLEPIPVGDRGYLRRQMVRLTDRSALRFGSLGYADAALASFAIFDRLQREGVIPARTKFQVSLPTPIAPLTVFVALADRASVERAYEAQLLAELARIVAGIPHDRLAIQWDVAVEIGLVEGAWPAHMANVEVAVHERLARIAAAVPLDVELGYHLCYGDFGHRHFMQPADAATLVRFANAIAARPRPVAWIHMPIPIDWVTASAYAPLRALKLAATTELYLGVVHLTDGLAGALGRIALASAFVPRFGIATECGWGRRPSESVPPLFALHAEILRTIAAQL